MKKLVRVTTIPLSLDKLLGNQLAFMNEYFDVIAVASEKEELKRVAEKYGIMHYCIEMTRTISPLTDVVSLYKMYRFLKKERPNLVHSHTPKAGIVAMMAAYFAGVPIRLHTVAGLPLLEARGTKRKILNFVEKLTYSFATKIYPNSFGLQEIIIENKFCSPDKLKVIATGSTNGIDLSHFNPEHFSEEEKVALKQNLNISDSNFVFVFIGRLVKDKGINELIHAFKKINELNPETKLLLVGPFEENLDPLLPESMDEISNNDSIICVGFQEDVRPYFAISDCLVFPSYREGFPNVVLQAGAMELPGIVSDINGCNEIIINGKNGYIVPSKNSEVLFHSMKKILDQKENLKEMGKIAREHIAENYEQNVIWEEIKKEYNRLENELK